MINLKFKVDFNTICELEDMGISIEDLGKFPMKVIRGFVAITNGVSLTEAGKMVEEYVENDGTLNDLTDSIMKALEDSGFFRSLQQAETKAAPKGKKSNP